MIQKALIKLLIAANLGVLVFWLGPRVISAGPTPSEAAAAELLETAWGLRQGPIAEIRSGLATRPGRKAVVALFTSVSTNCRSGQLVRRLARSAALNPETEYLALLPGDYSPQDARNLETNWNLPFPVRLADQDLTRAWRELSRRYGEQSLNQSVFVIDAEGMHAAPRPGNAWTP